MRVTGGCPKRKHAYPPREQWLMTVVGLPIDVVIVILVVVLEGKKQRGGWWWY